MSSLKHSIQNTREEYEKDFLSEENVPDNPVELFEKWINLAFSQGVPEPIAMNVATVNRNNKPSSRIVLLRGFDDNGFVFFTNYSSRKGDDLSVNPYAALCFYWYELNKQVRIEGTVSKVADGISDEYFNSRPRESQLGAWASEQSKVINGRKEFEERLADMERQYTGRVPRPPHWGGYSVTPDRFEFWQGRVSRLHDRIQYSKISGAWTMNRLAP